MKLLSRPRRAVDDDEGGCLAIPRSACACIGTASDEHAVGNAGQHGALSGTPCARTLCRRGARFPFRRYFPFTFGFLVPPTDQEDLPEPEADLDRDFDFGFCEPLLGARPPFRLLRDELREPPCL